MRGQIDLKQAQIFIQDGYTNAGAVNLLAGYTAGATVMAVDAITGIIPTGTTFTILGQDTEYEIVSHVETSGNTTSVTFIPALTDAVADGAVITFKPHRIEVRIGEGNLTYSEKVTREYKKDRGKLDVVRDGDEEQLEVSFDFVWDHIIGSSGDPITIEEALKQMGAASDWVSSSTEACEPYAVDLIVLHTPLCEGEEREQLVFPDFRYDSLDHDLKAGTVACKGACNVTRPIVTRLPVAA